jgi:hypothetical protein
VSDLYHKIDNTNYRKSFSHKPNGMKTNVYLCRTNHWAAVRSTRLFYMTELRLAIHLRQNNLPRIGDIVKFLSNVELGTATVEDIQHNGYSGHLVLKDIKDTAPFSTLACEPPHPTTEHENKESLEQQLMVIEVLQTDIAGSFEELQSQRTNIQRRLQGKPVQLTRKRKKTRR